MATLKDIKDTEDANLAKVTALTDAITGANRKLDRVIALIAELRAGSVDQPAIDALAAAASATSDALDAATAAEAEDEAKEDSIA